MQKKEAIRIYERVISDNAAYELLHFIRNKGFIYGWHSNKNIPYSHWNVAFSQTGVSAKNRKDIEAELPVLINKIWNHLKNKVFDGEGVLIRAYCNAYTYGTEGYIHRDSSVAKDQTLILYLTPDWNADWAGETVFLKKGEIIKAVLPKWRRLIIFPSLMPHVARAVSRCCIESRIVLVFKVRF